MPYNRRVRRFQLSYLVMLCSLLLPLSGWLGGCRKTDDLEKDESIKAVVAQERKLAAKEEDLLRSRGSLQRQRIRIRDKRASLITQKLALSADEDPDRRKKLETEETKLAKLEQRLLKQEISINSKLKSLLKRKSGLVIKAKSSKEASAILAARREHSVAQRERELAKREAILAAREKRLAERERLFAARQARLCPGRVTTIVQTLPASPPAASGSRYSRKDVEPLYRASLRAMRAKGILVADLPSGVDRLVTEIRHAVAKGKYTQAKLAADQLMAAVRRIKINRGFVGRKIGRLSAAIRRRPPAADKKAKIQKLFQQATTAYGDGRFRQANSKINSIYRYLR
jgi:hypothetical protein